MNSLKFVIRTNAFAKNLAANSEFLNVAKRMMATATDVTPLPQYETLALSYPKPFVVQVELNRPKKRNAMNAEMWIELRKCFEDLSYNGDCRAVVLSGAGATFCAGIDMSAFMDMGSKLGEPIDLARKCKFVFRNLQQYQASLTAIEKCLKPVISAVSGPCIGSGLDMITAADIRFCSNDAYFQVKEIDLGLAPDVGTLQRLPRVLGSESLVRELVFTARKFSSEEAIKSGLVSRIFETKESLIEGSIQVASEIASKSPVAVETSKRSILYSEEHGIADSLDHMALLNSTMLQSEDLMTAIMASMQKSEEPPQFSKL